MSCSDANLLGIFVSFFTVAISTPFAQCTDGELRLMNGTNISEGRVEICINRAWGSVCDQGFTKEDATVVCRQLGLLQDESTHCVQNKAL